MALGSFGRYEDVVANPQKEMQRIYNMLGLRVPEEVDKFLDLHSRQTRPNTTASGTPAARYLPVIVHYKQGAV